MYNNSKGGFLQTVALSASLALTAVGALVKFSTSVSESYKIENYVQEAKMIDLGIKASVLQYGCLPGYNCAPELFLRPALNDGIDKNRWFESAFDPSLKACGTALQNSTESYTKLHNSWGQGSCLTVGLLSSGNISFHVLADNINNTFNPATTFAYGYTSFQSKISKDFGWEIETMENVIANATPASPNAIVLTNVKNKNSNRIDLMATLGYKHTNYTSLGKYNTASVTVKEAKRISAKNEQSGIVDGKKIFFLNEDSGDASYTCVKFKEGSTTEVVFSENEGGRCLIGYVLQNLPDFKKA